MLTFRILSDKPTPAPIVRKGFVGFGVVTRLRPVPTSSFLPHPKRFATVAEEHAEFARLYALDVETRLPTNNRKKAQP